MELRQVQKEINCCERSQEDGMATENFRVEVVKMNLTEAINVFETVMAETKSMVKFISNNENKTEPSDSVYFRLARVLAIFLT